MQQGRGADGAIRLVLPWPLASARRRFVKRLRPRLVLVAALSDDRFEPVLHALAAEGAEIIHLRTARTPLPVHLGAKIRMTIDVADGDLDASRTALPTSSSLRNPQWQSIVAAFEPLPRRERSRRRPGMAGMLAERYGDAVLPGGRFEALLRRKYDNIGTLEELRRRLRRPEAILCLGNGPSAEEPAIREMTWDSCFRVNHSWRERHFVTEAQMVFTGSRSTVEALGAAVILGFASRQFAQATLKRYLFTRRCLSFMVAEHLGLLDSGHFAPFMPTNGAVMLAVAAALRPRKLIVGGIDLFSDPRGAYPDDPATPNDYGMFHSRELERAFIVGTLSRFDGELVVMGDALRNAMRMRLDCSG